MRPGSKTPARRSSKIDAVRELVGVLTDGEVAKQVGVSASAVHMYRRARGIPPAVPQGHHGRGPAVSVHPPAGQALTGNSSSAAAPPTPARTVVTTWGWRLTITTSTGEVTRFAVAADAGTACALARPFDVVAIERIGEGFA